MSVPEATPGSHKLRPVPAQFPHDPGQFPHDPARPLAVHVLGEEHREGVRVLDLTCDDGAGGRVSAYLVAPATHTTLAPGPEPAGSIEGGPGVVWAHWFDSEHPNADRTEFLPEAVDLAAQGVTSLLPQGAFPWASDPTDSTTDRGKIESEVLRLRRGLDLLLAGIEANVAPRHRPVRPVDAARMAMVGHDFGGMAVAVAVAVDRRPVAGVIMAATPRWGDWFLPFWPIVEDRLAYLAGLRLVDPIEWVGRLAPAAVLYQLARRDFYIARMTGHELHRATSEPRELRWYDAEHDLDLAEARADRLAFLRERLGLAS